MKSGDIKKCTKYQRHNMFESSMYINEELMFTDSFGYIESDSVIYKRNVILIKTKNGGYVDFEDLNGYLDLLKLKVKEFKKWIKIGNLILTTNASKVDTLFVDEESLKPYYKDNTKKNVPFKELKKNKDIF